MRNTSSPRTFSSIFTNVSPSGNGLTVDLPSSMPMKAQMASARGWLEVPLKIFTMRVLWKNLDWGIREPYLGMNVVDSFCQELRSLTYSANHGRIKFAMPQ